MIIYSYHVSRRGKEEEKNPICFGPFWVWGVTFSIFKATFTEKMGKCLIQKNNPAFYPTSQTN